MISRGPRAVPRREQQTHATAHTTVRDHTFSNLTHLGDSAYTQRPHNKLIAHHTITHRTDSQATECVDAAVSAVLVILKEKLVLKTKVMFHCVGSESV